MPARPISTLLIANRGEIACRVIRTARRLGLRTVAVYSEADHDALHVREADQAVPIGPAAARDSYLNIARLIDACKLSGAQAVHPGYGFLSENADFARACEQAGVTFVGPPPQAIDALGNKSAAKQLAQRIGVPCLPGYAGADQSITTLLAEARKVGTPLMIKAAAGGGGRGMRRCDDLTDDQAVTALMQAARNEAQASFGNGDLLLERLLETARHVEVQVFGDEQGNYVHLGERDCSTQRRNQKILEEAPAPGVSPELRQRMGESAVRLARQVGYVGAGTIEFLLVPGGEFYFLEMNTRLQVEHPVTEAITGLDLVEWQLRVAQGEPLPLTQAQIRLEGHAIEARLCAEDAFGGFVPQSGAIQYWHLADNQAVRVDHGLTAQAFVSPHYDSMIAKVIAYGSDREQARRKLIAALRASTIAGITTNRDYLLACLNDPHFATPELSTRWLTEAASSWQSPKPDFTWLACAAVLVTAQRGLTHGELGNWASNGPREVPMRIEVAGTVSEPRVRALSAGRYAVVLEGSSIELVLPQPPTSASRSPGTTSTTPGAWSGSIDVNGQRQPVVFVGDQDGGYLDFGDVGASFVDASRRPPARNSREANGEIIARMHGQVVAVGVIEGQSVTKGQVLMSIEAMKMEHRIAAPIDGTVSSLAVTIGQQVAPGRLMMRIAAAEAESAGTRGGATHPGKEQAA